MTGFMWWMLIMFGMFIGFLSLLAWVTEKGPDDQHSPKEDGFIPVEDIAGTYCTKCGQRVATEEGDGGKIQPQERP